MSATISPSPAHAHVGPVENTPRKGRGPGAERIWPIRERENPELASTRQVVAAGVRLWPLLTGASIPANPRRERVRGTVSVDDRHAVKRLGPRKVSRVAEVVVDLDADVVLLSEWGPVAGEPLGELLSASGWIHQAAAHTSLDVVAERSKKWGLFAASRRPVERVVIEQPPESPAGWWSLTLRGHCCRSGRLRDVGGVRCSGRRPRRSGRPAGPTTVRRVHETTRSRHVRRSLSGR
jgi:hypothetical protein